MKLRRCRAFTLVEMLVVIAIIAALSALLIPAVQNARERARQAQCMNNQHEIAMAIAAYEGAKQQLPGYVNQVTVPTFATVGCGTGNAPPVPTASAVTWAAVLLPFLGRQDLWDGNESANPTWSPGAPDPNTHGWRTGTPSPRTVAPWNQGSLPTVPSVMVRMNTFVCPDDTGATVPCSLSYVVNVSVASLFPAYNATETGVFRDLVPTRIGGAAPSTVPRPVSSSNIKSASQTPLLSEASYPMDLPATRPGDYGNGTSDKYTRRWYFFVATANVSGTPPSPYFNDTDLFSTTANPYNNSIVGTYLSSGRFGFIWPNVAPAPMVNSPFMPPSWLPQRMMHAGVAIVTFYDGHSETIADTTNCSTYPCPQVQ